MILQIPDLLSPGQVAQASGQLMSLTLADGQATAGWHAKSVKQNRQLTADMPEHAAFEALIRPMILQSPLFQMAVRPRYMSPIILNRYDCGMFYGPHVDDSIMAAPGRATASMRTDVSFTLFLTQPDLYDGGELLVEDSAQSFKLPAGSLLLYPSSSLHRVAPVTRGTRLAAIGWCQSEIRLAAQRAILFDLDRCRRALFGEAGKSEVFDLLSKSHANLLRMWAEV